MSKAFTGLFWLATTLLAYWFGLEHGSESVRIPIASPVNGKLPPQFNLEKVGVGERNTLSVDKTSPSTIQEPTSVDEQSSVHEQDAQPDKSILPTPEGFSKAWTARPFKRKIRQKYKLKLSTHGISHNPPVDVQKEMGFRNTVETLRDKKYDELKPGTNGNIHYMPFINIDKKFIAGLYEQFNLIDTLFLSTMSCIGFKKETKNFTEPCRKCFWCYEKKWAFGCYDGGQK